MSKANTVGKHCTTLTDDGKHYVVEWSVDVYDAENAVEAARQAFALMQRPGTSANCFTVTNDKGDRFLTDLADDEPLAVLV